MGWMSWEIFRCEVDCADYPNACINEDLYKAQTDALVAGGYLDAGYNGIHIDDCWMTTNPARDPVTHELTPNATRFPSGFKALGDYMHQKGVQFAIYTAESPTTCAGYPASAGNEQLDAQTFAGWGVDYLKVDGCGDNSYYPTGYPKMGAALQGSGRNISYSCSWPAYLGDDETTKPWSAIIDSGCYLWRNWDDIQCSPASLFSIIDHWGQYGQFLASVAGPGHWNDADMLLIGNDCISDDEARTQLSIWSIIASPLIMGNDLRNVTASQRAILLNKEAIAVNQDALMQAGYRITPAGAQEVWARNLTGGAYAVGLLNKLGNAGPAEPCVAWNVTVNGYQEACGGGNGDLDCFSGQSLDTVLASCCSNPLCAGFSWLEADQSGCTKANVDCGVVNATGYTGFSKPSFTPPTGAAVDITLDLTTVGFGASTKVLVHDIWAQKDVGVYTGSYTAKQVPYHGTAFLKLTKVA